MAFGKKLGKMAGSALKAYADKDGDGGGMSADFGKIVDKFKPKKKAADSKPMSSGKTDLYG